MPKSFTDEFNIKKRKLQSVKALDVILDMDANYFIDPALLRNCKVNEFKNATTIIENFFNNIRLIISLCEMTNRFKAA